MLWQKDTDWSNDCVVSDLDKKEKILCVSLAFLCVYSWLEQSLYLGSLLFHGLQYQWVPSVGIYTKGVISDPCEPQNF